MLDRLGPPPVPDGYELLDPGAGEDRTPTAEEILDVGIGPVCPA